MIGHYDKWIKHSKRLKVVSIIAASATGFLGIVHDCKIEDWENHPVIQYVITVSHSNSAWMIPILGIIILLVQLFDKIYGPPELWAVVHHILDEMHVMIFPPNCNKAENRITLFKVKNFSLTWPPWRSWGTWIVPVERSHHMTRKSRARWRVDDDGKAEGVAGQTYVQRACIHVENLPNIAPDSGGTILKLNPKRWFFKHFWKRRFLNDKQLLEIKFYAERTWTKESRLIAYTVAGRSMPRFLCGLPVEIYGKIWGVIVIDSRSPKLVDREKALEFYANKAAILSKLLETLK